VSDPQPPCALWLGPDEWLLRLPGETDAATAVMGLESALGELFYAANDVSSAQTVLRMAGPRVGEVLAKGCTLDLHPRVFGIGRCAQTNLAKTVAILMPVDDAGTMDVIVRRSFADYLARWLVDACR
jgi:sarcosine oxidase subunit gamma